MNDISSNAEIQGKTNFHENQILSNVKSTKQRIVFKLIKYEYMRHIDYGDPDRPPLPVCIV